MKRLSSAHKLAVLALASIALVGCKTTPKEPELVTCSCSDYFPSSSVDNTKYSQEIISDELYQSSGSAFCSGLKEVDIRLADEKAKENLAKLLSVKVETQESVKIANAGYGVMTQEYKQSSNLESKLTLRGAYIVHRWIDQDFCTITSSARISKQNADLSLASIEQSLDKSTFYLAGSGNDLIDGRLFQYFVEQGVRNISDKDPKQAFVIEADVRDVNDKSDKELSLTLVVKITDREKGEVRSLVSARGKGVSYKNLRRDQLYQRAIEDALFEIKAELSKAIKN